MKKKTVCIGIPAYNEEKNIQSLLRMILRQKEEGFILKRILILSDGSTDKTVRIVREVHDPRIELVEGRKRIGKSKRLNQIFRSCTEDILVLYDADTLLRKPDITKQLILPMLNKSVIAIVFGRQLPLQPRTFVEKLAYFGFFVWEDAKDILREKADLYRCHGQIRAFSRMFYQHYSIPSSLIGTEDLHCFYYAKQNLLKTISSKNVVSFFRLPNTFQDYVILMMRAINAPKSYEKVFEKKLLQKYRTITPKIMLQALVGRALRSNPIIVFGFLVLHTVARLKARNYKPKIAWDIVSSTKILSANNTG